MALSNILLEPRREITETLVGIGLIGGLIYLDYMGVNGLLSITNRQVEWLYFIGLMVVLPCVALLIGIIGTGLLVCIHDIGEDVCAKLEKQKIYLRPNYRIRKDITFGNNGAIITKKKVFFER